MTPLKNWDGLDWLIALGLLCVILACCNASVMAARVILLFHT